MFFYLYLSLDLGMEIFFEKNRAVEWKGFDFEIGRWGTFFILYYWGVQESFMQSLPAFLFLGDQKKNSF